MKKLVMLLLLATTVLTACKKEKEQTPQQKLEGRWDLAKRYSTETTNGQKAEVTEEFAVGDLYFIFKGNSYTLFQDNDLDDQGTFTATDNSITISGEDGTETLKLKWISNDEFVGIEEVSETDNGVTTIYRYENTYKRH